MTKLIGMKGFNANVDQLVDRHFGKVEAPDSISGVGSKIKVNIGE